MQERSAATASRVESAPPAGYPASRSLGWAEDAASTLIVSQDVDIAVPVSSLEAVKNRLRSVRGFRRSEREPSVWLPLS